MGARPAVWAAGHKALAALPALEYGWAYLTPVGVRTTDGTTCMGPDLTFGERVARDGRNVAFFGYGIGTTTLGGSYLGGVGNAAKSDLVSFISTFGASIPLKMIWILLGGNDALDATFTANFEANLVTFIDSVRALPISGASTARALVMNLHPAVVANLPAGRGDAINAAMASYAANAANNAEVLDVGPLFPGTATYVVDVHYTTPAQELIGQQAGVQFLAAVPP